MKRLLNRLFGSKTSRRSQQGSKNSFASCFEAMEERCLLTAPTVRMVYLVPSDRAFNSAYYSAISDATKNLQDWYSLEMGNGNHGKTFQVNNPVVEVVHTNHPASWYATHGSPGDGLKATYYDNMDFTGTSKERTDATINFDWGNGAPISGIASDTFSVLWNGWVVPQYTGTYTFYTQTDDGVRLSVDDTASDTDNPLIIDKWVDQPVTEWTGAVSLTAGTPYKIQMKYYEKAGGAIAKLLWSGPNTPKAIIPDSQLYSGSDSTWWNNVAADGFDLTGGAFHDPNNVWVYYIDSDPKCGQIQGAGTDGVAILPANDLRGLASQPTVPLCPGESYSTNVNRWIGGLGHELGHAFGRPHAPDSYQWLMSWGYLVYPDTHLTPDDKLALNASPFFTLPVPAYSSKPDAPTALYLDFDGHTETFKTSCTYLFGIQIDCDFATAVTPAFDLDGDPNSFTAGELDAIKDVWQRVAEDYAPFNVNVSTDLAEYQALGGVRVAFGGRWQDWLGEPASGVQLNTPGDDPNTVWVFTGTIGPDLPFTADVASQESGHHFGLKHQSCLNSSGNWVEYCPGTSAKAPIMGDTRHHPVRSTWWLGTNYDGGTQDDMAKLDSKLGYRVDDHGDSFSVASPLTRSGNQLSGSGIITTTADKDDFSFATSGGVVSLTINVAAVGANLDAKIELWRYDDGINPVWVASADPGATLGATITATLPAGKYYLIVQSHGAYGDVGQYTVTGSAPAGPVAYVDAASGNLVIEGADDSFGDTATVTFDNRRTLTPYDDQVSVTLVHNGQTFSQTFSRWKYIQNPFTHISLYLNTFDRIVFYGNAGDDKFFNNTPIDSTAYGGSGKDELNGGSASDVFYGGFDADVLRGAGGNDTLYGGNPFEDLLLVFVPKDYSDDILMGGNGDDVLKGGYGNDSLYGEAGFDRLFGEAGNDYLDGGYDGIADYLVGGLGADTFVAEWYWYFFSFKNRDLPQDQTAAQGDTIV